MNRVRPSLAPRRPISRLLRGRAARAVIGAAFAVAIMGLALALPAAGGNTESAELVAEQVGAPAQVLPGGIVKVPIDVSAAGQIPCHADESHSALAAIDTVYALAGGQALPSSGPGGDLTFFRGLAAQPPLTGCDVTWTGAPVPYRVNATVAVSPGTPPGDYTLPIGTTIGGKPGAMRDDSAGTLAVRVKAPPPPPLPPPPPPPPAGLSAPVEGKTVNLVPLQGTVTFQLPGSNKNVKLDGATQVPDNSQINADDGFVQVITDSKGAGKGTQSATFWNGTFVVGYSRSLVPAQSRSSGRKRARRKRRTKRPITELRLKRYCPGRSRRKARKSAALEVTDAAKRRRKRRGVFGRGKGRFRTRGSYGAGTVRGTYWYTESRCGYTLFEVFSGVVDVRDFVLGRTIRLRKGQAYLAGPFDPSKGASEG